MKSEEEIENEHVNQSESNAEKIRRATKESDRERVWIVQSHTR